MNVAIYTRVSTDDKGQDPRNQLLQLRAFAAKQSWQVVRVYEDRATGTNGDRPAFRQLMRDAARHRFDLLLFWSLDRLTREGTLKTLLYLRQLTDAGVKYQSYTEQYLDTLGVWGEAIAGVLATIAKQEQLRISERTKAGLARVRVTGTKSGKPIGRPRARVNTARIRQLREDGLTYSAIAKRMKTSRVVVWKRLNLPAQKGW
jgi:DNA invertase Pin-like site-specific DNA recombinase